MSLPGHDAVPEHEPAGVPATVAPGWTHEWAVLAPNAPVVHSSSRQAAGIVGNIVLAVAIVLALPLAAGAIAAAIGLLFRAIS